MSLRDPRHQHRSAAFSPVAWENISAAVSHCNQHNYLFHPKSNYKLNVGPLSHSKRRFTRGTKGLACSDEARERLLLRRAIASLVFSATRDLLLLSRLSRYNTCYVKANHDS